MAASSLVSPSPTCILAQPAACLPGACAVLVWMQFACTNLWCAFCVVLSHALHHLLLSNVCSLPVCPRVQANGCYASFCGRQERGCKRERTLLALQSVSCLVFALPPPGCTVQTRPVPCHVMHAPDSMLVQPAFQVPSALSCLQPP